MLAFRNSSKAHLTYSQSKIKKKQTKIDYSFPNAQFKIEGYKCFRKDGNAFGKRLLFYVNEKLNCRSLKSCLHNTFIEILPLELRLFQANIAMSVQLCFNVVYQRWSDVENETKSDVRFSKLHNFGTMSVSDVETTLKQRWYSFISTLLLRGLSISKNCIKTSQSRDTTDL